MPCDQYAKRYPCQQALTKKWQVLYPSHNKWQMTWIAYNHHQCSIVHDERGKHSYSIYLDQLKIFACLCWSFGWCYNDSFVCLLEARSKRQWWSNVIGRLYSVPYKSIFGTPDKVRCNTCDKARPLSQVWGVEPNTSSGYEVAEPPHHHQIIIGMQDCIPT